MLKKEKKEELEVFAIQIRIDILEMLLHCGYGHLGGSLSIVELMSVLYGGVANVDPLHPDKKDRDRVILSKGHCSSAWYSALAIRGFFPKEACLTLNQGGTMLPSHPDRQKTPGVDMTTGSLGQGASVAAGLALGMRLQHLDCYVYVIVGDGELNEGQCWEAFSFIANYKLSHCIVIIDENKRQLDGFTKDVMNPFSIDEKMQAFGFYVKRVKGNDVEAIYDALLDVKRIKKKAVCMILDTIKGQGLPFFETLKNNHSVKFSDALMRNEAQKALSILIHKYEEGRNDTTRK